MNENDTYAELVIGGLRRRVVELQKEWDSEMAKVNAAMEIGDLAGMSPAGIAPIQKELLQVQEQIAKFYINQQLKGIE